MLCGESNRWAPISAAPLDGPGVPGRHQPGDVFVGERFS